MPDPDRTNEMEEESAVAVIDAPATGAAEKEAHAEEPEAVAEAGVEVDSETAAEAGVEAAAEVGSEASPEAAAPGEEQAATEAAVQVPPLAADLDHVTSLEQAIQLMARLRNRMKAQILGRDEVIDLVLVALLADGHVLLEDYPGSGKTTLAKTLGGSIVDDRLDHYIAAFRRIQFTPDLLPSDVTGVSVFDASTNHFHFRHGPIFAHVVLSDEINRTSPKVQSAMLEAMAEKQVTVDNVTYPLDELFFVIATQNPLDLAGTYPLPVAQLDRFLFKIRMVHIDRESELDVLETYRDRRDTDRPDLPKVTRTQVLEARRVIDEKVVIDRQVKECLVDIAEAVRSDERVLQGNSTRSLVLMLPALQAVAALRGRDYVSADDVESLVPRVLGHRIEMAPGITDVDEVIGESMARAVERLSRSTLRRRI